MSIEDNLKEMDDTMCPRIDNWCGAEIGGIICLLPKHVECRYFKEGS